jgi:hypothetical protein
LRLSSVMKTCGCMVYQNESLDLSLIIVSTGSYILSRVCSSSFDRRHRIKEMNYEGPVLGTCCLKSASSSVEKRCGPYRCVLRFNFWQTTKRKIKMIVHRLWNGELKERRRIASVSHTEAKTSRKGVYRKSYLQNISAFPDSHNLN